MPNLKKIDKDETFSTKVEFKGKHVTATYAVSPSGDDKKNGNRYAVVTKFSFAGLSEQELMELALRPVIIDTQRRFRTTYAGDAKRALDGATWAEVDVKADIVEAARAPQDPKARVRSGFAKLTPQEKRKMIADLQASLNEKQEKAA